jgi:hypothetical protein
MAVLAKSDDRTKEMSEAEVLGMCIRATSRLQRDATEEQFEAFAKCAASKKTLTEAEACRQPILDAVAAKKQGLGAELTAKTAQLQKQIEDLGSQMDAAMQKVLAAANEEEKTVAEQELKGIQDQMAAAKKELDELRNQSNAAAKSAPPAGDSTATPQPGDTAAQPPAAE